MWVRIKIGLQDDGRGDLVEVTGALFTRNVHLDAGSARLLRAEGFVPHLNWDVRLTVECLGEARCAAARQVGLSAFIKGLANDDQPGSVFCCNGRHLRRVNRA